MSPATEGHRPSSGDAPALGDCIDCTLCVQVCPTGIDIRNGLQYECIACGACIDACDQVMDKMGYPRGLIRYSTQNAIDGRPSRILRPRVLVYGMLLSAIFAAWAWGIGQRSPLILDVLRDRNALYRESTEGMIENTYTLKLVNKRMRPGRYRIGVEGDSDIALIDAPLEVVVEAEQVLTLATTLHAERARVSGRRQVSFVVESVDEPDLRVERGTSFFAPSP